MRLVTQMLLMCLAVAAFFVPYAAAADPSDLDLFVVIVNVGDETEVDFLAQQLDVWAYHPEKGVLDAGVDAEGLAALEELGFLYEIDGERSERYSRPMARLKDQAEGIPGYPCYRTVEETLAAGAAMAAAHPDLAEWMDIGDSWEKTSPGGSPGYDLMVLRLTNETNGIPTGDKPKLWVMGSIHARELTTAETVTRFAEHLLAEYGVDPDVSWLLDYHEIHLLLVANPDGRKQAESGLSWRKNTNENYCGATSTDRGADLNRNFDFQWACCGGSSGYECDSTYRGPSPASEPEAQAVQAYVAASFPDWRPDDDLVTPAPDDAMGIFIDVHSYGGDVLTAFGFQDPPVPNDSQIHRLGRKFSYFNGYWARLGSVYAVDGSTKDWGYGRLGLPSFTFELGTDFFQDCPSFESTIYPDNLQALLYAARAARAPYTQSSGPEIVTPSALPTAPAPGETVTVTAVADDTRFGPGEDTPAVSIETIAAAEIYLDVPPWQAGAASVAMSASDGAFDSSVEAVTASFPSAGLADGRHTVFLRAQDAAGYWGTVRAIDLWVLDPATAAHVAGQLTDAATGLPVEGVVKAGPFAAASGPATGSYDLMLPAGTYDVTASAEGYGSSEVSGVVAVAGETTVLDVALSPFAEIFSDDAEGGNLGWIAEGAWALTDEASASPSHSWTDSPGGEYDDDWNISLTSPALDFSRHGGTTLEFSHIYELEDGYDYGRVEISSDGGASWTTVASYDGFASTSWTREVLDISSLDQVADARIRFRLDADFSNTEDGWHIDDIVIRAFADDSALLFADGFETAGTSRWSMTAP
ncbi:MAG: M14 family zinc carboxypeptidase [Thermoanaerobaculales bacterium]|jgi:hypothetical protein|nr:M14 family zinc carboxypeptidase [Thermoanaerobaculales bacterium]